MANELLFVVDDDRSHSKTLTLWLEEQGYRVEVFQDGELCLNMLDENPSAICLDFNLSTGGLSLLKRLRLANRDIPVLVITSDNALDSAVEAMKIGAFDYMVKPLDKIRLTTTVRKAIEMHTMALKIESLRGELKKTYAYKSLIGQSEAMKQVFAQIEKVSGININVFIQGESGTGKELVARAIHYNSSYKMGNFVAINCGAIPENLQESEFFGHEKGAFTSAEDSRVGKLELAHGGTLFLDEVGEMPPNMQVKLLRFLQDKSFERVGGNKKIHVDLRVISATNRILERAVETGAFRNDLYYRLVVYPIVLPSLRQRPEDIPLLVNHFLKKFNGDMHKTVVAVTSYALEAFLRYDWPGNVRELENVMYRAMVATRGDTIQIEHLPLEIQRFRNQWLEGQAGGESLRPEPPSLSSIRSDSPANHPPALPSPDPGQTNMEALERQAILDALKQTRGNIPQAAKQLGISRATFYRKIKKYRVS